MSAFDKENVSAKEAIDLLRLQKHDFLNYIQIISGYLQLGNLEKAKAYVQNATEELDRSGSIMRIANSALAINLLLRIYKAYENSGVNIDLYAATDLECFVPDQETTQFFDRVFSAIEEVYVASQGQQRVRIDFREKDEAYWMRISAQPFEAGLFSSLTERVKETMDLDYEVLVDRISEEMGNRLQVCLAKKIRSG